MKHHLDLPDACELALRPGGKLLATVNGKLRPWCRSTASEMLLSLLISTYLQNLLHSCGPSSQTFPSAGILLGRSFAAVHCVTALGSTKTFLYDQSCIFFPP